MALSRWIPERIDTKNNDKNLMRTLNLLHVAVRHFSKRFRIQCELSVNACRLPEREKFDISWVDCQNYTYLIWIQ